MKNWKTGKLSSLALLSALAVLMGYVEALMPPVAPIPGFKLGLCNIVVVYVLYRWGMPEALMVSAVRILIIGFLFGNLSGMIYSFAGTIPAVCLMSLLRRTGLFSPAGVSAAGGAAHNAGQLTAASVLLEGIPFFRYLSVLLVFGCAAGCLTGLALIMVMKRLPGRGGS